MTPLLLVMGPLATIAAAAWLLPFTSRTPPALTVSGPAIALLLPSTTRPPMVRLYGFTRALLKLRVPGPPPSR